MPYIIYYLGTDNEHEIVKGNILEYPNGETLSVASILQEKQAPISPESEVEHICNPTHTIIDGPKTLGFEVFHRINLGLFRLLKAVHANEQPLQIIAHSRGACQAILVSHEFDRIKKLLSYYSDTQIESSIDEIKAEFKKNIVKGLIISPEDEDAFFSVEHLKTIKRNISNSNISLFLLDPVPGGSYLGIDTVAKAADYVLSSIARTEKPLVKSLKWDDPLLYTLPDSVDYLEQFVYENEHSRCFKPVVPVLRHGMSDYSVQSLPGHHGTGSGNPYDQQYKFRNPEYNIENTLGVQKLVFSKLIYFLKNRGHKFDLEACPEHARPLAEVAKIVIDADEQQYKTHLIELYKHIYTNIKSYEEFNKTAYAWLGQEHGLSSLSGNTKRVIHHGSEKDTFLFDALPSGRTSDFLNWEHIELKMQAHLLLDFEHSNPVQCIRTLKESIIHPTKEFIALQNKLLIAIINNLSHAFIGDEINLSNKQKLEFLNELDSLMVFLKSKPDENMHKIIENALLTYINKKTKRLIKDSEKQLNRRNEDIETLNSLLIRDDLTPEDIAYVQSNLLILQNALPIPESVHPETPIGHEVSELLKQWTTEEEIKYNRLTFQKLCKNHKKLQELQKIINHFVTNDAYDSGKFNPININAGLEQIRNYLFIHTRKNNILLNHDQDVTHFYDLWLKQAQEQTVAYQAHLNHQYSSNSTILLNRKKVIVSKLLAQLNNLDQPAYVNIYQFQQQLDACKSELAEHRDPSWQRYLAIIAKCSLVFAIVAGSVMLGLTNGIALGIAVAALCTLSIGVTAYRKYQTHENFSFFNSKGQMYVDSVNKVPAHAC